jgi:hypothetical protein
MVTRFIFYPFVFLLVYWNAFHSGSSHSPTSCSFGDRIERDYFVFIDNSNILDLIEEDFQCIEEENSTERNDDGRDEGSSFDHDNGLQQKWLPTVKDLIRTACTFIPSTSVMARAVPLYLLIRVFRI